MNLSRQTILNGLIVLATSVPWSLGMMPRLWFVWAPPLIWLVAAIARHRTGFQSCAEGGHPTRRHSGGAWADPPVAELDKSTFGILLKDRLRRNPDLRVVPHRLGGGATSPDAPDDLHDRELV